MEASELTPKSWSKKAIGPYPMQLLTNYLLPYNNSKSYNLIAHQEKAPRGKGCRLVLLSDGLIEYGNMLGPWSKFSHYVRYSMEKGSSVIPETNISSLLGKWNVDNFHVLF